jgi:hypothetical protein
MKIKLKKFDVVALLNDVKTEKLVKSSIGTIIDILDNSFFLVEFSDKKGIAYSGLELKAKEI